MPFSLRPHRRSLLTYCFLGLWSLIALLLLSSGPAYAEWVRVGESSSGATIYVEPDTIRRNGDFVMMWELTDYKTIIYFGGSSFMSIKIESQFDCAGERARVLILKEFSGSMGSGTVVLSDTDVQKWAPVARDNILKVLWKFACEKK